MVWWWRSSVGGSHGGRPVVQRANEAEAGEETDEFGRVIMAGDQERDVGNRLALTAGTKRLVEGRETAPGAMTTSRAAMTSSARATRKIGPRLE